MRLITPPILGEIIPVEAVREEFPSAGGGEMKGELYEKILENSQVGIYIVQDGEFIYVNPEFEKYTGYSREELRGRRSLDLVHPEDREMVRENAIKMLKGLRKEPYEYRSIRKDGKINWVMERVTSIEFGGRRAVLGSYMNITERKMLEESLHEMHRRLDLLINNIRDVIFTIDPEYNFVFLNRAAEGLSGYSLEELYRMKVQELLAPEYAPLFRERAEDILAGRREEDLFEVELLRRDGERRRIEIAAGILRDKAGKAIGVQGVARDLTPQYGFETEMIRRYHNMAVICDTALAMSGAKSPEEILQWELERLLEFMSMPAGALALFEKGRLSTFISKDIPPQMRKAAERPENWKAIVREVVMEGLSAFVENMELDSKWSSEDLALGFRSFAAVPVRAGREISGILLLLDRKPRVFSSWERRFLEISGIYMGISIASLVLMEKAMRAETLEELEEMRSRLIGDLSHALKTPLTVIKGYITSLLQEDVKWDEETRREFLQIANREVDKLSGMIERILQAAKLESRVIEFTKRKADLGKIIKQIEGELKALARHHPLELRIPEPLPSVEIDEERIAEVISELVKNAGDHSPQGAPITIEVEVGESEIIVSVEDKGEGIPLEEQGKIFERFYRSRKKGEGVGLGLSICKRIIEAHGGGIWVRSFPGRGSRFSFSLPLRKGDNVGEKEDFDNRG